MSVRRRRALLLPVLVVVCLALGAGTSWATNATLTGGETAQWVVTDAATTNNGLPQGGSCQPSVTNGSGAATLDATIPEGSDAFDFATMAWVDGTQVGGVGVFTANEANFAPVAISGLVVQMNYRALSTQSTLRVLLRLFNPTGAPISVPVEYVNNFGSDSSTQVNASSSGDLGYGPEDRWIVTSDGFDSDAVNTSVFYGPGAPAEVPVSTSATVCNQSGTQGSLDRFELEIPAGEREQLMFFQQLNPTVANAQADTFQFDATPPIGHGLTEGMQAGDFGIIVNWDYASAPAECSNGADDDGDGRVDHPADRQCESPSDPSERSQCDDDLDNDADGDIDYPDDPGCRSARDNSESPNPQCSDGVDNDGDGVSDHPGDPGCASRRDNNETNAACADGVDNDGDGRTDHPADAGCGSRTDNSESPDPQCGDGVDNDADGRTDYPEDPGCSRARDNSESPDAQCGDGVDNDGDGRTDYPGDPGCSSPRDNSESPDPQCGDFIDNDEDTLIDYPDDPGCRSPRDNSEDTDNPPVET
jgi:hypothetical protein